MTMLAFHGRQRVKDALLAKLAEHREHDEFVQGFYKMEYRSKAGESRFKGCAVGCTIHETNADGPPAYTHRLHVMYEAFYGIPTLLAHLEDATFEYLSVRAAKKWPIAFIEAIEPGADLSGVVDVVLKKLARKKRFKEYVRSPEFYERLETEPFITVVRDVPLIMPKYVPDTVFEVAKIAFGLPSGSEVSNDVARIILETLRERKPRKKKLSVKEICRSLIHTGTTAGAFDEIPKRYRPVTREQYFKHLHLADD